MITVSDRAGFVQAGESYRKFLCEGLSGVLNSWMEFERCLAKARNMDTRGSALAFQSMLEHNMLVCPLHFDLMISIAERAGLADEAAEFRAARSSWIEQTSKNPVHLGRLFTDI